MPLVVPFLGLAINAAVQTAGVRIVPDLALLKWMQVGFLAGLAAVGTWEAMLLSWTVPETGGTSIAIAVSDAVLYAVLSYCYFHFVNLGGTARRVRIMREIHLSDGGLTLTQTLARYNAQEIVEKRLDRLLNNGQVDEIDGRIHARKSALLAVVRLMSLLQRVMPR